LAPNLLVQDPESEASMIANDILRTTVLAAALLLPACTASRPHTETVASQRLKDSAPERSAALRAATPGLELEAEDQRWGIEAARARKSERNPRPHADPAPPPAAGAAAIDVKTPTNP
jgi:hypothetical protein